MKAVSKIVTGFTGALAVSSAGGVTYTQMSATTEPTKQTAKVQKPVITAYTFDFGTNQFTLECPEGSFPDDSLDISERPHNKLSIHCKMERLYGRKTYWQKNTFKWEDLNSFRGKAPTCKATNSKMTAYKCENPGKHAVTLMTSERKIPDYATSTWIRIA
ncbi:hypothetical protein MHLP_03045 [Candidatus Mycoplasma haematolamae str. Purdue]|uniref:Uncharacterized protein n=1 Tax=Mycoplasma haematolamae (strain Purdue) TaxID=1212765 RepID=I7CJY3_MYCHA|nr:hypothetical protein [Candidatus Mycoplasma haematolamae]AFO52189.1 hypothetical protein MHLP_03045 [Candidatus Mycoplasma haematolamae str. Purdue]